MKEIIVVSHGTLAEGLIDSSKVILGDMLEAKSCCLKQGMGINEFKENISAMISEIDKSKQIIVLADLKGGSPYTTTLSVLDENGFLDRSLIFTGVNLPLLINIAFKKEIKKEDMDELINESRKGIDKFEIVEDIDEDI